MPRYAAVNGVIVSILDGLTDPCLLVNDALRLVYANEAARTLFGMGESVRLMPLEQILAEPLALALVQRARQDGQTLEKEIRVRLQPNHATTERHLLINVSRLQWRKQGHGYLRILLRDQTERYTAEQVRQAFVANASHELRTPLSIINGYLENLVDGVVDDPQQLKRCLHTMRQHGERIACIIEDMLTLSKLESAKDPPLLEGFRQDQFSLRECTRDVIERLHLLSEAKQANISVDMAADAEFIAGDRFYWDQIMFNLLENALRENALGIAIQVTTKRVGETVILTVTDNGVGISAADLPLVFQRFFRVAQPHSHSTIKGTGLGLSIVSRAIEAHGGTISVESTRGVATTFTLLLPDPEMEG